MNRTQRLSTEETLPATRAIPRSPETYSITDSRALQAALVTESQRKQISLRIDSGQIKDNSVMFTYTASDLPAKGALQLVAVLVDDVDQSSVLRG